ncbi:MAG TPA: flippase [Bacteroidia bacterium]|nr:flippase [Bacteroidia bacterium]
MRFLTNIISTFFKSEDDRKRLYKVVIPSFIIHFFAAILALTFMFIMTRGLGSKQYGLFTYSFSIVFIIVNLATYGICVMAVRETPALLAKGKKGLWIGLHKWSVKFLVLISMAFALVVATFITVSTFYLHILKETAYTIPLLLALCTIPVYGLMNYYASILRGQQKIVLSLLPDNIVKPVIFLLSLGLIYAITRKFTLPDAILLNALSFAGAAAFAMVIFYKTTTFKGTLAEYDTPHWRNSLKPFFLFMIITSINSRMDILMLGFLKDSSQVGIYSVADMIGSKVTLFLLIMNQVTAASIARMHSLEEKQKLQELVTKTSRWVFIITLPVFLFIVIFRKWIMTYFGADFDSGQTALLIIASGQIVNIAFGPVGNFALMTGNQRYPIIFTSINIVINLTLNLILTPTLGINGTAIATTCAIVTWNTGMFLTIRKKTGVRTWIFG